MVVIRKWFWIVAFAVMGIVSASAYAELAPRDMFIENESPLKFTDTVEALRTEMVANGWSVLAIHDLSAALAKKGHNVLPVSIIEACSGKFSVSLLKNEQTRYVSSLLPCRLSVYETADGRVIISRMNTEIMGAQMESDVATVMAKAGASVEAIIAKVTSKK